MKMLRKSCFSVVSLDFHRFYRHVLAGSTGNGRILFSFGDTYLHLPRDRVPESLWKPHQSKAINFLHRNYVTTFFPTPTKKYVFSGSKIFFEKKSAKIIFLWKSRKNLKFWFQTTFFKFQIFFGIFTEKYFWPIFFRKIFFIPKKNIFWLELEKKLVHSFDVENWELSIYEVFRAILALRRDVGANIWHTHFKNRINFAPVPLADFMNFENSYRKIENHARSTYMYFELFV